MIKKVFHALSEYFLMGSVVIEAWVYKHFIADIRNYIIYEENILCITMDLYPIHDVTQKKHSGILLFCCIS